VTLDNCASLLIVFLFAAVANLSSTAVAVTVFALFGDDPEDISCLPLLAKSAGSFEGDRLLTYLESTFFSAYTTSDVFVRLSTVWFFSVTGCNIIKGFEWSYSG
jgi:hypothetical protein